MAENVARIHTQNLMSLIPGGSGAVNVDMDRLLKNVHAEDKTTVHNVVSTLHVLRTHEFVSNIEIVNHRVGYDVIGTLCKSVDKDLMILTSSDFEIIQSVSPARISSIMIQVSNKALELVIRVFSHDTPIVYSSVQITHINKRKRLSL